MALFVTGTVALILYLLDKYVVIGSGALLISYLVIMGCVFRDSEDYEVDSVIVTLAQPTFFGLAIYVGTYDILSLVVMIPAVGITLIVISNWIERLDLFS